MSVVAPPCVSRVLFGSWRPTCLDTYRPHLTPDFLLIFTCYLDFFQPSKLCLLRMRYSNALPHMHLTYDLSTFVAFPHPERALLQILQLAFAEEVLVRAIHSGTTFLEHLASASAAQGDTNWHLFGSGARQGLSQGGHDLPGRKQDNATCIVEPRFDFEVRYGQNAPVQVTEVPRQQPLSFEKTHMCLSVLLSQRTQNTSTLMGSDVRSRTPTPRSCPLPNIFS